MASHEIGIRELKNQASAIVARAEAGEVITVTRRGRPVARVIPAGTTAAMTKLIEAGRIEWSGTALPTSKPIPLRGCGPSAADYVIEGRR